MMTPCRRAFLALSAGALLAGCERRMAIRTLPVVGFASSAALPLDVAAVTFVNEAPAADVAEPARDVRFDLSEWPGDVIGRWSRERLRAAGDRGEARVVLLESRFVAVPLDTAETLEGLFTDEQSLAYEGSLAVRIEIVDHPSGSGFAEASSYRRRTVPESLSIMEREEALHALYQDVVAALDGQLEVEMAEHLWRWIMDP